MPCFYKDPSGKIIGPVSIDDARKLAAQRVIGRDTLMAKTPEGPWVTAGRLRGFLDASSEASTQPAGPGRPIPPSAPIPEADSPAVVAPGGSLFNTPPTRRELAAKLIALARQRFALLFSLAGVALLVFVGAVVMSSGRSKPTGKAPVQNVARDGQPSSARSESDASLVLRLAFMNAEHIRGTAQAVAMATKSGTPKEGLLQICEDTERATKAMVTATLQEYMETSAHAPATRQALEMVSRCLQASLEEMRTVKAVVAEGKGGDGMRAVIDADEKCSALAAEARRALLRRELESIVSENAAEGNTRPETGGAVAAPPKRPRRGPCPVGWAELTQLTGDEGPSAKYIRNRDGELQRVEAFYGGSVVAAVTKVDEGFRVTVSNEVAVADFTSRPWFTQEETDGLVEAYSQYVAKAYGSTDEKVIGRFRVKLEQDPQLPIRLSFVLRAAE